MKESETNKRMGAHGCMLVLFMGYMRVGPPLSRRLLPGERAVPGAKAGRPRSAPGAKRAADLESFEHSF